MSALPLELPQVSAGHAALSPAARRVGQRVAGRIAACLGTQLGAPVQLRARALPGVVAPVPGAVRLDLSLAAVPAHAALEVEGSLVARLVDRLADGSGDLPAALEPTPVERAALDLLALTALCGAAEDPQVATALGPRLASAAAEVPGALDVEVEVEAGAARGTCRLLLPPAALRALAAPGPLCDAVAAWPVGGALCSGFAALTAEELRSLQVDDVLLLDEPPSSRALLLLPGLAIRGRDQDGLFHVEDIAMAEPNSHLPLVLTVELARVSLTLGDLSGLEPGGSLPLHAPRDGRVVLRLGDRPVARGQLVEIDGALGVRLDALEALP